MKGPMDKLAESMARSLKTAIVERGIVACRLNAESKLEPCLKLLDEVLADYSTAWCAQFAKSLAGHAVVKP